MLAKKLDNDSHICKDDIILERLDHIKVDIGMLDKRLEKLDARMWQIIILLLSYPLGLMIGKITHIF